MCFRRRTCLVLTSLTLAVLVVTAWTFESAAQEAQDKDSDRESEITARIQQQYDSLVSFQADYVQTLTAAATGQAQERAGTIYYHEPRLIRWETDVPEQELLVIGANEVWNYFKSENLAIKYPVEAIMGSKTVIRFISGQADLSSDFQVRQLDDEEGMVKLELVPKTPEPGLVLAFAWVDTENFILKKVAIVDFYGNENSVRLKDMRINPDLEKGLFVFTPPQGAMIQDNTVQTP
jgi:outer membrane lipoprotein carrier protein